MENRYEKNNRHFNNNISYHLSLIRVHRTIHLSTGTKAAKLMKILLNQKGAIVDNESRDISYTWAYNLNWKVENDEHMAATSFNAGQVGSTISYDFAGNYLAVAFCETYHAIKILIYIDDVLVAEHTPFANDKNLAVIRKQDNLCKRQS